MKVLLVSIIIALSVAGCSAPTSVDAHLTRQNEVSLSDQEIIAKCKERIYMYTEEMRKADRQGEYSDDSFVLGLWILMINTGYDFGNDYNAAECWFEWATGNRASDLIERCIKANRYPSAQLAVDMAVDSGKPEYMFTMLMAYETATDDSASEGFRTRISSLLRHEKNNRVLHPDRKFWIAMLESLGNSDGAAK
jgi:hypothetical protein